MKKLILFLSLVAAVFLIDSSTAAAYQFTKSLSVGMRGADVISLQTLLKQQGFLHIHQLQDILDQALKLPLLPFSEQKALVL